MLTTAFFQSFRNVVEPENVASLKVQVGSQVVHLPADPTRVPFYEPEHIWTNITESRPGGVEVA